MILILRQELITAQNVLSYAAGGFSSGSRTCSVASYSPLGDMLFHAATKGFFSASNINLRASTSKAIYNPRALFFWYLVFYAKVASRGGNVSDYNFCCFEVLLYGPVDARLNSPRLEVTKKRELHVRNKTC